LPTFQYFEFVLKSAYLALELELQPFSFIVGVVYDQAVEFLVHISTGLPQQEQSKTEQNEDVYCLCDEI